MTNIPHGGGGGGNADVTGTTLCIPAWARADCAACRRCGRNSAWAQPPLLADAPVGGRRVVIRLQVLRLFCRDTACQKRTFAEQAPGLAAGYARKTLPLAGVLQHIAVAAGRAGRNQAGMRAFRRATRRGIRTIAKHLGWGRHTVQRYARAATWQELADGRWQAPRPSKLDPFKPHLHQRADERCGNATSSSGISARAATTAAIAPSATTSTAAAAAPPPPPTAREVTG